MLDKSKVSESSATEETVRRLAEGGWIFFAKWKGSWKSYFLDGENGIIKDGKTADDFVREAFESPDCERYLLLRIELVCHGAGKTPA